MTRADARRIGLAALELGAGRRRVEDSVDPAVGLEVDVRVGARVEIGDPLATIHARDDDGAVRARERLDEAILIEDEAPHPGATDAGATPLVLERIAGEA